MDARDALFIVFELAPIYASCKGNLRASPRKSCSGSEGRLLEASTRRARAEQDRSAAGLLLEGCAEVVGGVGSGCVRLQRAAEALGLLRVDVALGCGGCGLEPRDTAAPVHPEESCCWDLECMSCFTKWEVF
jgi:hypothetical protein